MLPCAKHGRVGDVLKVFHHIGCSGQSVGIEVPHAVVVFFQSGSHQREDVVPVVEGCRVESCIEVRLGMVVYLSFLVAYDSLYAPHVGVVAACSVAVYAGCESLCPAYCLYELCGMVGEQEPSVALHIVLDVAHYVYHFLGQMLPSFLHSHSVYDNHEAWKLVYVQAGHVGRLYECTCALCHIVVVEPLGRGQFVIVWQLCIVVCQKQEGCFLHQIIFYMHHGRCSFRHQAVAVFGLYGVEIVGIDVGPLYGVRSNRVVDVGNLYIVFIQQNPRSIGRQCPREGELPAVVGPCKVGRGLRGYSIRKVYIRAGAEHQQHQ